MKKAILFLVTCMFAIALLCGCGTRKDSGQEYNSDGIITITDDKPDDKAPDNNPEDKEKEENIPSDGKNLHGEVNELLTVEELADFHLNGAKYPENFVFWESEGQGLVIESTSSREEALLAAEKLLTEKDCIILENRLAVETDLFYGIYLKKSHYSSALDRTLYYDYYLVSFKADVYDAETERFFTNDIDEVASIMNYLFYGWSYNWQGFKVYSADVSLINNSCEYTAYVLIAIYGDWGIQDELAFLRIDCHIDLATGELTHDYERVGTAFIDGKYTHSGGIEA